MFTDTAQIGINGMRECGNVSQTISALYKKASVATPMIPIMVKTIIIVRKISRALLRLKRHGELSTHVSHPGAQVTQLNMLSLISSPCL